MKQFDWKEHRGPGVPNSRRISPWLMRTQWPAQLSPMVGKEEQLCLYARFPRRDEEELHHLHAVVTAYFERATGLIRHTDELVLQKLNSYNPDKDSSGINNTPLHAHHQGKTIVQYIAPVTRLLATLLRECDVYELPRTPALKTAVTALRDSSATWKQVHAVVMALWTHCWVKSEECPFPDPTMSFLMLFSLQEDGHFADAQDTTGPIAKFSRAIQLTLLTQIKKTFDEGLYASQLEAFEAVAEYIVEKVPTTFNSLRSLQHYASALAYKTMSYPRIWWTDRDNWEELLYRGQRIALSDLGKIMDKLEKDIINLWENEVLLGLDLHVEYGVVVDDLLNSEGGYSFITDKRNPFHALRMALFTAICNDPVLREQFTEPKPDGSGKRQPNAKFAKKWMRSLSELELLMMLAIELFGGATSRVTELAAMLAMNTWTRHRNWRALGKFIAVIREYDKTTNTAQSDRLIPHSLPGVIGDLIVQVHTFARPLAQQFLAPIVFPTRKSVVTDYAEMLFMGFGDEVTTNDLSQAMALHSALVLGWGMTINPNRHINIAFRQKHCSKAGSIQTLEEETWSVANVQQSGHSSGLEKRTYGLSPESLVAAPEEVLQLYLEVSSEWQKVTKTVPGGLGLKYREAMRSKFDGLVATGVIKLRPGAAPPGLVVGGGASVQAITDPAFASMCAEFQKTSEALSRRVIAKQDQILAKQNETLAVVIALRDDVALMRRQLGMQGRPVHDSPTRVALSTEDSTVDSWSNEATEEPSWSNEASSPRLFTEEPTVDSSVPQHVEVRTVDSSVGEHDMLQVLRDRMQKPDALWKNEQQRRGVKALMELSEDVIIKTPTGAGKSVIAWLPTLAENGITVLVLPLIALLEDWVRRLELMKIPFEVFRGKGHKLQGDKNLILVSSDVVRYGPWTEAIQQLNTDSRRVLRYIYDEGQFYFAQGKFRAETFERPSDLRLFPAQVAIFSATVPPDALEFLKEAFCLKRGVRVIGAISDRPELEIVVKRSDSML
ncbi:hypothetical protein C8F04DRAFT_957224, partial [Mycena alexandri]